MGLKLTAVIPTYNVGSHLSQALASVLEQSRQCDEIIIADDCSTDATLEVARSFADSRICILTTERNSGSAVARNIGINAATGDLIAMLDGDDYWLGEHVQTVAGLLEDHRSASLAFSSTRAFGAQNWIWPIRIPTDRPVKCFWDCVPQTIIPHMNVVVRRDAILAVGGYRESMMQSQDYDLFLRLAHRYPFVCTDRITSAYRRHPGSITTRHPLNSQHCIYLARNYMARELAERGSTDSKKFNLLCLDLWEDSLRRCCNKHNWHQMDFHLSQAALVPGADEVLLGWKVRRAAGVLQWMWDVANRPLRRSA